MSTGIPQSKRDMIAAKIRALLALSRNEGATEAESMLAAERASEMMSKYAIATADLEALTPGSVKESWGFRRRDVADSTHVVRYCLLAIGRFTDTIPTWYRVNDSAGNLVKLQIAFFGTRVDTEIAHWLVDMIRATIDRETSQYVASVKGEIHGKTARISFSQGMALRVSERLAEIKDAQDERVGRTLGSTALVVNKIAERNEAAKGAGMNPEHKAKDKSVKLDPRAGDAGKAAAERVQFNTAIENKPDNVKRLT